jgi:hypothetical protein
MMNYGGLGGGGWWDFVQFGTLPFGQGHYNCYIKKVQIE